MHSFATLVTETMSSFWLYVVKGAGRWFPGLFFAWGSKDNTDIQQLGAMMQEWLFRLDKPAKTHAAHSDNLGDLEASAALSAHDALVETTTASLAAVIRFRFRLLGVHIVIVILRTHAATHACRGAAVSCELGFHCGGEVWMSMVLKKARGISQILSLHVLPPSLGYLLSFLLPPLIK